MADQYLIYCTCGHTKGRHKRKRHPGIFVDDDGDPTFCLTCLCPQFIKFEGKGNPRNKNLVRYRRRHDMF